MNAITQAVFVFCAPIVTVMSVACYYTLRDILIELRRK
jgi:hypothetical protein